MACGLAGKMHLSNLHFYHLCVKVFNIRKCPLKNPPSKRNAVVHTPDYRLARERMVKNQLIPRGIKDPQVLEAMGKIPRDRFVEEALVNEAYNDHPLPIGHNQTISQPYIVALMTEALEHGIKSRLSQDLGYTTSAPSKASFMS